VVVYLGIA